MRSGGYWADAEFLASGPRPDFDAVTFVPVRAGGYGLLNLSAGLRPARDWSLRARVENVLDRDYEQVSGYRSAGLSILAELSYRPVRGAAVAAP